MARLAGEVADGVLPQSFVSLRYLREVMVPNIQIGLERAGRTWDDIEFEARGGFQIFGETQADIEKRFEWLRHRIAWYGSTRTYFPVWDVHGRRDLGERLHALSLEQKWDEMDKLVTDDVVEEFAQTSTYDDLPRYVADRADFATRIHIPIPVNTPAQRERFDHIVSEIKKIQPRRGAAAAVAAARQTTANP
jgi:hypothetical protein